MFVFLTEEDKQELKAVEPESPHDKAMLHDMVYIGEHLNEVFNHVVGIDFWHNGALSALIDRQAVMMCMALTLGGPPQDLHERLAVLCEQFFIAGYMAGEGPEHIKKCTELHTDQN